jgi:hypothetical protein
MNRFAQLAVVMAASFPWAQAHAALSCPFADGNGSTSGMCIEGQGSWQTSLQTRDFGANGTIDAYYDPFLDLTWLADANLSRTLGFHPTGALSLSELADAEEQFRSMALFGGSNWRLPTQTPVNGQAFNFELSNNGSTDRGYAKTGEGWGEHSEMGYMFYVHLGNKGFFLPNDADPGANDIQPGWGLANTGPFANLQSSVYWSDEALRPLDADVFTVFNFSNGAQFRIGPDAGWHAWAVHPGDLIGAPAPVPLPGAALLLGPVLAGLLARPRRRRVVLACRSGFSPTAEVEPAGRL